MREDKVFAAGMEVERLAQVLCGHHGALNVPARAPRTDAGLPLGFAGLRRLPQRKIAGVIFFVLIYIHACADFHAGKIFF